MASSADLEVIEQTLYFVAQKGWQAGADDFHTGLVTHLAKTLDVEFAFVGRLTGQDNSQAETVALYAHGEIAENIRHDLEGTPFEAVFSQGLCTQLRDARTVFPEDALLTDMSVESYVGIPLWASDGDPLGLIVVLSCSPLEDPELASTLLRIVAARAAAQIEREIFDQALRESEARQETTRIDERFLNAIENLQEGMALYDADERLLLCNRKYKTRFGAAADYTVPGATFEGIVRARIEHGSFPNLVEGHEEQWIEERLRQFRDPSALVEFPTGQGWLQVRNERLPDGGTIVLDLDITDRKEREEKLRESEARLRSIIDNAPFVLSLKGRNGRYLVANRYFLQSVGRPWSDIEGRTAEEIYPSDIGKRISRMDDEVFAKGQPIRQLLEVEDEFKSPGIREVTKFPIIDEAGNVTGVGVISVDITARKQAEDALRVSEQRFKNFAESTSDWLWEMGPDLRFTWVSSPGEATLPHPGEFYIGKSADELGIPDEGREEWLQYLEDLKAHRPFRNVKYARTRPDGGRRHLETSGTPLLDADGNFRGYRGAGRDITAEVEAEQALRTSEARLKAIIDHAPFVVNLKDLDRKFILVNRRFAEAVDLSPEELLDKTSHEVLPGAFANRMVQQDDEVIRTGAAIQIELPSTHEGGTTGARSIVKFPVFNSDGEVVAVGSFSFDLTEQKQREEVLRQAQKMEAVGQLTGGLAHDFNNLLTVVLGNLELLSERVADDETAFDYAGRAILGAQRGADLTHRLLAFSRKQALVPVIINPRELVDGMLDLIRRTIGETIEIVVAGSDDLWRSEADPAQLESAVLNLAINARDAMPGGGKLTIETVNVAFDNVSAAAQAEVAPGNYVMVAVTDTGTGMPRDAIEHAFDPFFTTKEIGKGSGLGLSMVYGFVKQSGGHVTIYSEEGVGTTVKMYLPRSLEEAEAARDEEHETEPRSRGEIILVVEDDPEVRMLAVALLSNLGYRVLEARDGRSALAALDRTSRVDLLFTDVVLPEGMSGPKLAAEVKRRFPAVAVLFTSGYTNNAIIHQGRLDKGVELLNKPYRRVALAHKIRSVLDKPST